MASVDDEGRAKWNARYRDAVPERPQPAAVLSDHEHLLPTTGGAGLDLACGRGGNALFLAARGFRVQAWDIADAAIAQLRDQAAADGLRLEAGVRDVLARPPAPASFDVIVVSRFLERDLIPALLAALRPGGLLFYQTFIREAADPDIGPRNPDYRLGPNELLRLCAGLQILVYREENRQGDLRRGWRNEALLVGRRDDT